MNHEKNPMAPIEVFHSSGPMAKIKKEFMEFVKEKFDGEIYHSNIFYPANICFRLYLEELRQAFYANLISRVEVEFIDGPELKMTLRIMVQSPEIGRISLNPFMDFISDGNGYIVDGSSDCFVLEKSDIIFSLPKTKKEYE